MRATQGLRKPHKAKVTVIIPLEPESRPRALLGHLVGLGEGPFSLEILVAQGRQPSRQRNLAAAKAKGEWLLFLDADSRPVPGQLEIMLKAAQRWDAAVVGGPNLGTADQNWLQSVFSELQASRFGSGSSRARYARVGQSRLSGEKELILCNLLVRHDIFKRLGGFREDLYPNEENEFLDRLADLGQKQVYEPGAWLARPRRASIIEFSHQAFRYGRGRAQQSRIHFQSGDFFRFLPLVGFALALGSLIWLPRMAMLLWASYGFGVLLSSLALGARLIDLWAFLLSLMLYPLRHLSYAMGLAWGLLSRRPEALATKVKVSKLNWPPRLQDFRENII